MGEVYLAQDTVLERVVALKVLRPEVATDAERMRRFTLEAKAAAALNHPHIAHIYEIGQDRETSFIAMEFVEGETLREKIHKQETDLKRLLAWLTQVAEGLAKAHSAGIVHRDLKPDNIMISRDGYAKILDFGLVKLLETHQFLNSNLEASGEAATAIMPQQHSAPGLVMGTVGYMSPEQAQGKNSKIDHRSDIFSFGCILYEAATKHRPFESDTVIDSLHRLIHAQAPAIRDFNPGAPPGLQRIVRKCLAKDPEERYQTIKDTVLDLKELVRELESEDALEQTVVPPAPQGTVSGAGNRRRALSAADPPAPISTAEAGRATTSSAEYIVGELKRHKRGVGLMLAVLLVVVAGAMVLRFRRAPALTEKDTILLADFVNTTGDGIFDGTLKQALAVQLGQSPFLNIFPEQGVRDTLQLMNRSPDERVTRDVAREICERRGLKAMLTGSISNLGSHYVITLEALNGRTGETIAREQSEAESKEQVIRTLGQAATKLREKLGESLGSIQKFDAPIEEATTSSLEALKAYSQGRENTARGGDYNSAQFYKRAIELDPNFASAYVALAVFFYNGGQPGIAAEHAQKAFDLRERVSEHEKLRVSAFYYTLVTGELDKAGEVLALATQTYPRDSTMHINLGNTYLITGQFDKAIDASREAIRLDPNQVASQVNLGQAFIGLNRFPEAREVFERALERKLDTTDFHIGLYQIAFINHHTQAMKRQIDLMNNRPERYVGLDWQTQSASFGGQLQRAREFSRNAIDLAVNSNVKEVAARYTAEGALRNATFGKCQQTKAEAAHALAIERNTVSMTRSALALALCGESAQTQQIIDDLSKRYPKDTLVNALWIPCIRAVLELNRNNLGQAGELLETTKRYEAVGEFWPNYLRGLTYLRQHAGTEAAGEFQKILDHRGRAPLSYLYPLSRLGLGRAMGLAGDKLASQKAYQDFLAGWKDADGDLPVYQEARKEYEGVR